jgi:hypothetical protein
MVRVSSREKNTGTGSGFGEDRGKEEVAGVLLIHLRSRLEQQQCQGARAAKVDRGGRYRRRKTTGILHITP